MKRRRKKQNPNKNRKLLDAYQGIECFLLSCQTMPTTTGHHLKFKGSGGHDQPYNLMALCFKHHRRVHDKYTLAEFAKKYTEVTEFLIENDWEYNEFIDKWVHPKMRF